MDLFSGLNDDQSALVGCAVALVVCGGMLSLSSIFGRAKADSAKESTLKFPVESVRSRPGAVIVAAETKSSDRRAA